MEKLRFILKTYEGHPKNHGVFMPPNWERLAWEKMAEEINPPLKYLRHFIDEEWVDTSDKDGFYQSPDRSISALKIPLGVLTYYLIVYVE